MIPKIFWVLNFVFLLYAAPATSWAKLQQSMKIDCMVGDDNLQARIAVGVDRGTIQSIAFYSKWKPYTCSIALERGDWQGRWTERNGVTTVPLEGGSLSFHLNGDHLVFTFKNVNRMRYCGMYGELNGTMSINTRNTTQCFVGDGLLSL